MREEEAWGDLIYHHWLKNGEGGMKEGVREPLITSGSWFAVCKESRDLQLQCEMIKRYCLKPEFVIICFIAIEN